jgi:hypothetical protein
MLFNQILLRRPELFKCKFILDFFNISENLPIDENEYLKKLATIHSRLPISDFVFIEKQSLIANVSSKCSLTGKLDASLYRFFARPRNSVSTGENANSVGLLKVFRMVPRQNFTYTKINSQTFTARALCCAFNLELSLIATGTEHGEIFVFYVKSIRSIETSLSLSYSLHCHKKRINGLIFDEYYPFLYCYSDDGFLTIHDLETKTMINCYIKSNICLSVHIMFDGISPNRQEIVCRRLFRIHSYLRPYSSRIIRFLPKRFR